TGDRSSLYFPGLEAIIGISPQLFLSRKKQGNEVLPRKLLVKFHNKVVFMGNNSLYHRNFVEMNDISSEELDLILKQAAELKAKLKRGESQRILEGKTLAMIFEKQSTRTRVSFEVGMFQLGGHALYLSSHDTQIGRGETVEDTARVLSGFVDCIMART